MLFTAESLGAQAIENDASRPLLLSRFTVSCSLLMLRLPSISLLQFKNYTEARFDFTKRIICLHGSNGAGKTNLLDAIHYLCFTRSYFSRTDAAAVQQGKSGFRIEGQFILNGIPEQATCILRENGKKTFAINGQPYERFSQHIGRYPCVIIAPDDAQLITGDSRERRSFLDALLCQMDTAYMEQLIVYKKVLEQRNSLLRGFAETGSKNFDLLDVLDEQLTGPATFIFDERKEFLVGFLPAVKHLYHEIARRQEEVHLYYESQLLEATQPELMKAARQKDLYAQRTTAGIHRDEIDIRFGEQPFKQVASQGQRKSLLFALKLAEMEVLRREKHFSPLLLLDDIFEKLDEERISNLLQKVCLENDGQVFITDTNEERLRKCLNALKADCEMVEL